ncbi:MAG TPA: hypothetical protein PKZ53_23320, partial [Acidobacteriota bacterium]|nr:hypothetical protein [Acidobacteriota bacterium]
FCPELASLQPQAPGPGMFSPQCVRWEIKNGANLTKLLQTNTLLARLKEAASQKNHGQGSSIEEMQEQ